MDLAGQRRKCTLALVRDAFRRKEGAGCRSARRSGVVFPACTGADYIFALLTGYKDVPAGVAERETQYYNPYFAGGWIGMPPPIADGAVDYDDGTPNTTTQASR